jgi:nucleoside-diphosphate-sugar epimerase
MTPDLEAERSRPREIVEVNEVSTISILMNSIKHDVQRVVYVSSGAVYEEDDQRTYAMNEDSPLHNGDRIYALSKISAERMCRWAHAHFGLDVRIVRLGTVYGPYERPTFSRQRMSHAYTAVHAALAGESLRSNAAHSRQNWVHARDIGKAIQLILEAKTLHHDTYNISGESVSMTRLAQAVVAAVPGTEVEWVEQEEQANLPVPADRFRSSMDNSRLWRDTGFQPSYTIETGIKQYVETVKDA